MKIRGRFLVLLLSIALVPVIIIAVLHLASIRRLGKHLASGRRQALEEDARYQLRLIVDGYGSMLRRRIDAFGQKTILAIRIQALQVEKKLAAPPPSSPVMYFPEDYEKELDPLHALTMSGKHQQRITYDEQVYVKASGVDDDAVKDDMARLSTMPEVYLQVYVTNPDYIYWQHTSLEAGFHTSYPGHGGSPLPDDHRESEWYKQAQETGDIVWRISPNPPMRSRFEKGPSVSGLVALGMLAMPVYRLDGSFAGVTAIEASYAGFIGSPEIPEKWREVAEGMITYDYGPESPFGEGVLVLSQESSEEHEKGAEKTMRGILIDTSTHEELQALAQDVANGKPGVRRAPYEGKDSLWAYSASSPGTPVAIVILPTDVVFAEAVNAERFVLNETLTQLKIAAFLVAVVVLVVAILAVQRARRITSPINQLAEAGKRLADGDYEAQVGITTGDELQDLGEVFNSTGPLLRERQRMRHSLELAREIQQQLLPKESPTLEGFDIAGTCVYCEEVGGDYYDFIQLIELGSGKLGIALGDVSGHGIGAALFMSSVRGVLLARIGSHGMELGKLLEDVNRHLTRDVGTGQFMTLFYGVLDSADRSLHWVSAGHGPSFWLKSSTGELVELESTGIPLGVAAHTPYPPPNHIALQSGDVVLAGTDGMWEARNPEGEMFGLARIREILKASPEKTADGICAALVDAANNFARSAPQEDDITLIVIKAL